MHSTKACGFAAALCFLVIPAAAQLAISYHATSTLDVYYNPADLDEGDPAILTISTTSAPPTSVNYNGVTGTFQLDFLAPEGFRFVVNPLDGPVGMSFQIAYNTYNAGGASGGLSATGTPTITLLGLEGTAPTFYNYSTLADLPHAYLSVTLYSGDVTAPLSFTGLRYSVAFTGTGNNLLNPLREGGNLSVYDSDYTGAAPGAHLELLTVAAIPEPGTYAALAGVAALMAGAWRRRSQDNRRAPATVES
jgi:hypothetical protein